MTYLKFEPEDRPNEHLEETSAKDVDEGDMTRTVTTSVELDILIHQNGGYDGEESWLWSLVWES